MKREADVHEQGGAVLEANHRIGQILHIIVGRIIIRSLVIGKIAHVGAVAELPVCVARNRFYFRPAHQVPA
ncbi:hypothetical protein D3C73_1588440 [compost metagenome]